MTSRFIAQMLLLFIVFQFISCGSAAKKVAQAILCGRGESKNKMSVGLDLGILTGILGLRADESVSDEDLKEYFNTKLSDVGISSSQFNVKSVESVISGDNVRFLELGGNFSPIFGVAKDLFKSAFDGGDDNAELDENSPLTFINESFPVQSTTAQSIYYQSKIDEITARIPFFNLIAGDPNPDQWAYNQTEFAKAKALYLRMAEKAGIDLEDEANQIKVAVLDTGVDKDHVDLKDLLVDGYDATGSEISWDDANGHGTHCAGIIAGQANSDASALGVASMANVKIMPVKVLGDNGSGGFDSIEKGVRHAVSKGAKVLSMSLGAGLEYNDLDKQSGKLRNQVFEDAIDQGALILVAAGNENCPLGGECANSSGFFSNTFDTYTVLPCHYEGTICVGATDSDETLAEYSNYYSGESGKPYKTAAEVNAPGTNIYSTWSDGGYKIISGTSMATPYVAGIAALLKTVLPDLDQKTLLKYLAKGQVFPDEIKERSNTGRVDLYAVLNAVARDELGMTDEEEYTPEPTKVEDPQPSASAPGLGSLWGTLVCQ